MRYIRQHLEMPAAGLLAVLLLGVAYPTFHRVEHALEFHVQQAGGHDHSEHDAAVENTQPSLVADSCWLCARQLTTATKLLSVEADPYPADEREKSGPNVHIGSRTYHPVSPRAPPFVI